MIHSTELTIYENGGEDEIVLDIKVLYDWQPSEPATRVYPGCAAEASIYNVTCDNPIFDYDELSQSTTESLENECYQSMFNDSYDDRE